MAPGLQTDLRKKFADPDQKLAIQNHMYGIPPKYYQRWPILEEWYDVLSTSKDRNGIEYISTMEGKKYPFTGGCCGGWGVAGITGEEAGWIWLGGLGCTGVRWRAGEGANIPSLVTQC